MRRIDVTLLALAVANLAGIVAVLSEAWRSADALTEPAHHADVVVFPPERIRPECAVLPCEQPALPGGNCQRHTEQARPSFERAIAEAGAAIADEAQSRTLAIWNTGPRPTFFDAVRVAEDGGLYADPENTECGWVCPLDDCGRTGFAPTMHQANIDAARHYRDMHDSTATL